MVIDRRAALVEAYRNAEYRISSATPFTLRIGQRSEELDQLLNEFGMLRAAIITGDNPFGQQRGQGWNDMVYECLATRLTERGIGTIEATGGDATGNWPAEHGFLALGIDETEAERIGIIFGQYAIVWIGADAVPELKLCGSWGSHS